MCASAARVSTVVRAMLAWQDLVLVLRLLQRLQAAKTSAAAAVTTSQATVMTCRGLVRQCAVFFCGLCYSVVACGAVDNCR